MVNSVIDPDICDDDVRVEILALLTIIGTNKPSLQQIWAAMDFVWGCMDIDNRDPDLEKLSRFYSHPVWLLNGLFIEQHEESLRHREIFADWIQGVKPIRVVDFGGGFGTLARAIADRCPEVFVEVVEPYPRPEALRASSKYRNLAFKAKLDGEYSVVIATDVFEHVTDPVGLAYEVGSHVPVGGHFLMANHFAPSIKCHLPSAFHFNQSWDKVMERLGFEKEARVSYGTVYRRVSEATGIQAARKVENYSRLLHRMPKFRGASRLKRLLWRVAPI